jgi:hypothetical protein
MRIIFLDMDGVLCTTRAHYAQGYLNMPNHGFMDALDREGIGMLNKFNAEHPDVIYVLSSTWRKHHTKKEMEEWLKDKYGWNGKFHDDWRTDDGGPIRGNEIQRWLDKHQVDNYLILDDSSDMLPEQQYHFIHTDDYNGISFENYEHMEKVFADGNLAR